MADNKNQRGSQDRNRVAGDEEWEVRYMIQKFNVTKEEVEKAVQAVGNNRDKVEEYLRKKGSKK